MKKIMIAGLLYFSVVNTSFVMTADTSQCLAYVAAELKHQRMMKDNWGMLHSLGLMQKSTPELVIVKLMCLRTSSQGYCPKIGAIEEWKGSVKEELGKDFEKLPLFVQIVFEGWVR